MAAYLLKYRDKFTLNLTIFAHVFQWPLHFKWISTVLWKSKRHVIWELPKAKLNKVVYNNAQNSVVKWTEMLGMAYSNAQNSVVKWTEMLGIVYSNTQNSVVKWAEMLGMVYSNAQNSVVKWTEMLSINKNKWEEWTQQKRIYLIAVRGYKMMDYKRKLYIKNWK